MKELQPLNDNVMLDITEDSTVQKTASGIIIPDSAKEKPQKGEIVAAGQGKKGDDGKIVPLDVKPGDKVLFGKYSGNEIKIDGEECLIMR